MHRGTDPEAIRIAEEHGLSFDGMQEIPGEPSVYQFTVQEPEFAKSATFYVSTLEELPAKLDSKLNEFEITFKIPWQEEPATAAQRGLLNKMNIPYQSDITKEQFSDIMKWRRLKPPDPGVSRLY